MRIREILDASGAFALRYVYECVHFGRVYVVSDVFFLFCLSRCSPCTASGMNGREY